MKSTRRSMRVVVRACVASVVVVTMVSGCVTGRPRVSPFGRTAWVLPNGKAAVKGELIAVSADSVWLRSEAALQGWAMSEVQRVYVQTNDMTAGRALTWSAIGAVVTGVTLFAACESVNEGDCGQVLGVMALVWGVFGGTSAILLDQSSKRAVTPAQWEALRPYARFPQGVPDAQTWEALRR